MLRSLRSRAGLATGRYARLLARRPFPGVAVLTYHGVRDDCVRREAVRGGELHVSASRLAEHCQVLRDLCTPISADQFLEAARSGAPLPERAVLVTFDDGYATWLTHALPILERFQVPSVMFICPDPVARGVRFWFDAVAERAGAGAVEAMKQLPYDRWLEETRRQEMVCAAGDSHAPLTVDGVRALARSPLVEIGGHTVTHPILANAPATQQRDEIAGCAATLAEWTGRRPRLFAYPNGRPGLDYSAETVSIVRDVFDDGFALGEAFAQPGRDPGEHRRFLVLDTVTGSELADRLAIAWPRPGA